MAGRRRARDGILANPLARFYERRAAGLVGPRLSLSSAAYGLLYEAIGWRGLLWLGVLPALVVLWVRNYVKEPEIWKQNREQQRQQKREVHPPLIEIFRWRVLPNTLTACLWMGSGFVSYYTIFGLFPTHLQKDLGFEPGGVALPILLSNLMLFVSNCIWGAVADKIGRRWAMIIPASDRHCRDAVLSRLFTTSYVVWLRPLSCRAFSPARCTARTRAI